MADTMGINHLGLAVKDLQASRSFFTELLAWTESGYDASYPRTAVSDGKLRLTLWQVDQTGKVIDFNRRSNVGLHHLALELESEKKLHELHSRLRKFPGVVMEFAPELVGDGPRMHMMCNEPGGIRIEFIWQGA
ncbi:MAG: VOC family protein [Pseudomonadales bacterium]